MFTMFSNDITKDAGIIFTGEAMGAGFNEGFEIGKRNSDDFFEL